VDNREWAMNDSIVLQSRGVGKCIIERNDEIESRKNRAITIMRYHLTEVLRDQYQNVNDPHDLWEKLNSRFTLVLRRKAEKEWNKLRFQDFESVDDYNTALM